jgi:formate/nitrite transporter FocA (FNT family)
MNEILGQLLGTIIGGIIGGIFVCGLLYIFKYRHEDK